MSTEKKIKSLNMSKAIIIASKTLAEKLGLEPNEIGEATKEALELIDSEIQKLSTQETEEWPKVGDKYFGVSSACVKKSKWNNNGYDQDRKNGLGLFKEERVAQYYFERNKLLREIDEFCDAKNPKGWDYLNYEGRTYSVCYSRSDRSLDIKYWVSLMLGYGY